MTACDEVMRRAIERAGNKLKGRAGRLRDTLRNVPAIAAAATLGPTLVADAGLSLDDLLAGGFEDLSVRYALWARQASEHATDIIATLIGNWDVSARELVGQQFDVSIADSVQYLRSNLLELGKTKLFDPTLTQTADLIPQGFVRAVTSIAGGQANITTQGDAWVALDIHGAPVPGLGTGPVLVDALAQAGGSVEGYRWVYGPALRRNPFEPHVHLDGLAFVSFTDSRLANPHDWPPFSHYIPGDHAGCSCDFEPILLSPDEAAALDPTAPTGGPPVGAVVA